MGFFDEAFWTMTPHSLKRRVIKFPWEIRCPQCQGEGWDAGPGGPFECPRCEGVGVLTEKRNKEIKAIEELSQLAMCTCGHSRIMHGGGFGGCIHSDCYVWKQPECLGFTLAEQVKEDYDVHSI